SFTTAGPSSGMGGNPQEATSPNPGLQEVTTTVSRTDQSPLTALTYCHPAEVAHARRRPCGGAPSTPRLQAQHPHPASQPLPQLLQLHLPSQMTVQHRLATVNSPFAAGNGGNGGSGAAHVGGWGAALEAMLERVAPRPDNYSPPAASPAPAAGWGNPHVNNGSHAVVGSNRASAAGNLVEYSGRGTVIASMRRLGGQIKSWVSSTGVLGTLEVAPSDHSSRLSINSCGTSAAAIAGGGGGAGTNGPRGLLCTTSSLSHQPANGAVLSMDGKATSIQSDAPCGAEPSFQMPSVSSKLGRGNSPARGPIGFAPRSYQRTNARASATGRAATAPASPMGLGARRCDHWREDTRSKHSCYGSAALERRDTGASPAEGVAAGTAGTEAATEASFEDGYIGGEPITTVTTLSVREADGGENGGIDESRATQCGTAFYRTSSYTSRGIATKDDDDTAAAVRGIAEVMKAHQVPLPCKPPSSSMVNDSGNPEQEDAGGCGGPLLFGLSCLFRIPRRRSSKSSVTRHSSSIRGLSSWP
ncbi:hypothetical protein Vretifemale_9070, partial [Volvox reticuliferus]